MVEPTVISTFAGCGGSSLGYRLAGYKELLAVEWDDNAVETFKLNFPEVPVYHGDITELTSDECMRLAGAGKGELDVFDGSPPCQGFSTAGKRKFDDPRNSLFMEYVRLLNEMQPKVFVMENVTGMVKGYMKQAYLQIVKTLRACGYRVKGQVMNAMYYNVPQSRERVIIIGVRNDIGIGPSHPKPQTRPVTVREAWVGVSDDGTGNRVYGPHTQIHKEMKAVQPGSQHPRHFSKQRISYDRPSPTISKGCDGDLWHPSKNRVLTLSECKRLATFPDEWIFAGRCREAWARIGNSVPPNLMRAIAEHIKANILSL